jgi:hypothetical protein
MVRSRLNSPTRGKRRKLPPRCSNLSFRVLHLILASCLVYVHPLLLYDMLGSIRTAITSLRASPLASSSRVTLAAFGQTPVGQNVAGPSSIFGMAQGQVRFRSQFAPKRTKYRKAQKGRVSVRPLSLVLSCSVSRFCRQRTARSFRIDHRTIHSTSLLPGIQLTCRSPQEAV